MRQLFVSDGEGSHIYFFNQNIFLSEQIGREQYKVCYTCLKRKGKYIFSLYTNKDSLLVLSTSGRNRNQKHYLPLGKRTGWVEDNWGVYLLLILYSMYTVCTYCLLKNWNKQGEGKWGDQSGSCDNSPGKRHWAKMVVGRWRKVDSSKSFFLFFERKSTGLLIRSVWEMRESEESRMSPRLLLSNRMSGRVGYLNWCCVGSWAWRPRLEFNLFYSLTLWPWANHVSALYLRGLICKMRMLIWPTYRVDVRIKLVNTCPL